MTPCTYLLGSGRDTAQLKGSEPCGSGYTFFSLRKAGCPEGQAGGGESDANTPKPVWAREARAWARTVGTSEVLKTLRKRLFLGDPRSEEPTTKTPSLEADDAIVTLAKAIRVLVKRGNVGSGSEVTGEEGNEDSLEQPFLAAPGRACQDLNIQARRFPGRILAGALNIMERFLWSRVGGGTRSEVLSRVLTSLESVFNQLYTKKCAWDPHSPGDAYTGRGRRLPPGRRQHEDGRPLDPVVQGGGDALIRRVMVARAPPRADFRGECGADVAGTAGSHWKTRIGASTPSRRWGCQAKVSGLRRHENLNKRGFPCRESESRHGQSSDFSRRAARCHRTANSTGAGWRGVDEKSWSCKAGSKSEEEADYGPEDEAQRKGRVGQRSASASGFGGKGTRENKYCTSAGAWRVGTLPRIASVQGVWEAGAKQQLWTRGDRAWSISVFVAVAAPGLPPAALVFRNFKGMATRGSRLGLATPGLLRTGFETPSRGRRRRDLPPLPVPWKWPPYADVVLHTAGSCRPGRRQHSRDGRQFRRVAEIWCLAYSGCGHIRDLQVPRGSSTAVEFPGLQQIIEGSRYLLSGAPEDRALMTPSLDYAKVLSRKRFGCGRKVAASSEALTLLELLPGMPLERTVDIVEPLAIAERKFGDSLRDHEPMVVAPEQCVAARPALVHTSNEKWTKIDGELVRRNLVVEIDLSDKPVVHWFRVLVWVLDVVESRVAASVPRLIVRFVVSAIPSSSLQRRILLEGEKMPERNDCFYVYLRESEMTLSSICDFFECFHVLSVPVPWRKWMILSKPIRQPVEGSTDSRGVDRRCGGNAPRDHPSDVRLERVWLALAVIRMGWLSAVGKVQHLHRRMVRTGVLSWCGLDPSSELLREKPFPMRKPPPPFFVVERVYGQFWHR